MDQSTFDMLDRLERGAREMRAPRHASDYSRAEYSAYDGPEYEYTQETGHPYDVQYGRDEFDDQQMPFDSFDEGPMHQPDYHSVDFQAAPLQPNHGSRDTFNRSVPTMQQQPFATRSFDLSRFALDQDEDLKSSSSQFDQPRHSSTAFNASQRRPAPSAYESARQDRQSLQRNSFPDANSYSRHQPGGIEHLETKEQVIPMTQRDVEQFQPSYNPATQVSKSRQKQSATPIVQGISLVSTRALPDRFRTVFPFPLFNAVQSKSFETIYNSNDNFVLSAPTGSGKTAILELAICRLVSGFAIGSFKIVYQAPTKSLCSERQRDWQEKFAPLDLKCAELTGDSDVAQLRSVQHASIIITTPEKWDSITRKWKDHQKLMQMVKLFLIDEVHILKEDRGATLEAVVSRMKTVGSNVRFIALSATVPNSDDIATWLGKDPMNAHVPASREKFGEEFRPVRLQKHVCSYQANLNDFAFDRMLESKLPEVIAKWSQRKPIMIFCFTRKACAETAKTLSNWWAAKGSRDRYWSAPRKQMTVGDKDLRETIFSGVAFHHAGLHTQDRAVIEKGYLEGEISVICCTSTLAVGVNLPCHMVIIKGTVTYHGNNAGCKEYSDLEVMQMLGRAGRPQFDDSAVAVIMTRTHLASHYEKMISGQEILESCLHNNLIDHLNAEIGLGTVTSVSSARKWLSGTFLFVRLKENPDHYNLGENAAGHSLEDRLEKFCRNAIAGLQEEKLIQGSHKLHCTEFGGAMARYYIQFETMRGLLTLGPQAKISEILSAICQAAEFQDIRFRGGEKPVYKTLNKNSSIKFPVPGEVKSFAHKVSLIIQSVLGAVDLPSEEGKQTFEYLANKTAIFQHVHRFIRCVIDCQLYLEDSVSVRNALMLARSLGAQVWDDSPLHMKQLESFGIVSVRKLVSAGVTTIEDLENSEPHQIEQILSRNPPYGLQMRDKARAFPKLRISLKIMGEPQIKKGEHVAIKIKAEIGFMNEKVPEVFQKKAVYVCLLAETSDGHKIHFARISAKKLNKGQDVLFSANLTSPSQSIRAYVMCDEIAGTMRNVVLTPKVPAHAFPPSKAPEEQEEAITGPSTASANTSKRRTSLNNAKRKASIDSDQFDDPTLEDADLARFDPGSHVDVDGFVDIDEFDDSGERRGQPAKKKKKKTNDVANEADEPEPQQLPNGKWVCKHACKDKTACKHFCCREGLDHKPKPSKPSKPKDRKGSDSASDLKQTQLNLGTAKKTTSNTASKSTTEKATSKTANKPADSQQARDLNRLHDSVTTKKTNVPILGQTQKSKESKTNPSQLSFLKKARDPQQTTSTEYGSDAFDSDDLPDMEEITTADPARRMNSTMNGDNDSNLDLGVVDRMDKDAGLSGPFNSVGASDDMNLPLHAETDEGDFAEATGGLNEKINDDLELQPQLDSQQAGSNAPGKEQKDVFLGYSTGDPASSDPYKGDERTIRKQSKPGKRMPESSKFFTSTAKTSQPQEPISRQPAAGSRKASDVQLISTMTKQHAKEDTISGGAGPAEEEDAGSEDSLEKWFTGMFGKEHFNFVG